MSDSVRPHRQQPTRLLCPWDGSGKSAQVSCHCLLWRHRRHSLNSWVGKIPWRRRWQSIPGFLPEKSHGQRSLTGYSPWGHTELDMTERLNHRYPPSTFHTLKIQSQRKQAWGLCYSVYIPASFKVTSYFFNYTCEYYREKSA